MLLRSILLRALSATPRRMIAASDASHTMSPALAAVDDMLEAPSDCVMAVSPYQTLAGPALQVQFEHDSSLFPFQQHSFAHPSVPSVYTHVLLNSLAEFSEMKRETKRHQNTPLMVAPMRNFWDRVGNVNTVYCTLYPEGYRIDRTMTASTSASHPTAGAVELVQSTHRQGLLDLRSSLYDAGYRPLCTTLLTGSEESDESTVRKHMIMQEDVDREQSALQRRRLVPMSEPETDANGDRRQRTDSPLMRGVTPLRDPKTQQLMGVAALCTPHGGSDPTPSRTGLPIPPWIQLSMVDSFTRAMIDHWPTMGGVPDIPQPKCSEGGPAWTLVAYHTNQNGDMYFDEDVECVCGAPKYFPSYNMPKWKHKIGLPLLQGEPCLVQFVELRQRELLVTRGVFYYGLV